MTDRLDALARSGDRLRAVVDGLDPTGSPTRIPDRVDDRRRAVPPRLGGGDPAAAGSTTRWPACPPPTSAAQAVWDEWNAKAPAGPGGRGAVADRALLERLAGLDRRGALGIRVRHGADGLRLRRVRRAPAQRARPAPVGHRGRPRPGRHAGADAGGRRGGQPQIIARFTAGRRRGATVTVATTDPTRAVVVVLGPDEVSVSASDPRGAPDLVLPAEALCAWSTAGSTPTTPRAVRGAGWTCVRACPRPCPVRLPGADRPAGWCSAGTRGVGRATANMARQPSTVTRVHDQAARGRDRSVVTTTSDRGPECEPRAGRLAAAGAAAQEPMVDRGRRQERDPGDSAPRALIRWGSPAIPDRASSSRSARVLTKWAPDPEQRGGHHRRPAGATGGRAARG